MTVGIDRELAKKLVEQFTAFAAPPMLQGGLTTTIDTLVACARSERHARAIVREIVETPGDPPRWPAPDRIRSVAWQLLSEEERTPQCSRCGGSGWHHFTRLVRGVSHDFSQRCSCRGGAAEAHDGKMSAAGA